MRDGHAERRRFILSHAQAAVESGRLTPQAAVDEALAKWAKTREVERQVTALVDAMDSEDAPCPSCHAEPAGPHQDWCEA